MKLIRKYLIPSSVFCLIFIVSTQSIGAELSYEKKTLIDELSIAQGDKFIDDQIATSMTNEVRDYLASAKIDVGEEFFEIFYEVVQEVVYQELLVSGELHELNYEIWGERFNIDELKELIAFYKTPLGVKLVKSLPKLSQMSSDRTLDLHQRINPIISYQLKEQLDLAGIDIEALNPNSVKFGQNIDQPSESELEKMKEERCSDANADKRTHVYRGPPTYPYTARIFGIEGWVELAYAIRADGSTTDIIVSNASTGSLFNAAAIDAVMRYRYCASELASKTKIRIRFEMAKNQKASTNQQVKAEKGKRKLKEGSRYDFFKSKAFKNDFKTYGTNKARKAFAVASDGDDNWASSWRNNHRTQAKANSKAIEDCNNRRKRQGIENPCQLLMIGDELTKPFQEYKALKKLAKSVHNKEYQSNSVFEQMLEHHKGRAQPKALALIENINGAFQYYNVSNSDSQEAANSEALSKCNESKMEKFEGDCKLFMIGDYPADSVPRLNQMKGVWQGQLETRKHGAKDETSSSDYVTLKLDNCGDFPKIYNIYPETEKFKLFGRLLEVSEKAGNVVLSSVVDGEDWVETQIWSLIKLNVHEAVVQWNRMVSNLELEQTDDMREFGYIGTGRLKKLEMGCGASLESK